MGDLNSVEYFRWFNGWLLEDIDTVIRGRVGGPRAAYLSDDQREVYTDYPIEDPVFLYQAAMVASAVPGKVEAPVVTLLGGRVTINGLSFNSVHQTLPSLKPGMECLFLLKRVGSRYFVAGKYEGVFSVEGLLLLPLSQRAFAVPPTYRTTPVQHAIETLIREVAARR